MMADQKITKQKATAPGKVQRWHQSKKGKGIISQFPKRYKTMRRTNSKEAMEAIKNAIIESYNNCEEYYTYDGTEAKTEYNDICKDIMNVFFNEKCKYNNRYNAGRISKQDLFIDWMQGLPTAFDVADDIFLGSAVDWLGDILEQTDAEKARYTDEQAEKTACYLLYRELTKHAAKAN